MKKTLGIVALLAMSFGMVGCDNYMTPKGAVETVAINLQKGDVKEFKKGLVGKAALVYGSKAGLIALRAKMSGLKGLRIENATLVSVKPVRNNGFQTAIKTYSVGVVATVKAAKDVRIISATVTCDIFEMDSAMCTSRVGNTSEGACMYGEKDEYSECKVADLN